MFEPISSTKTSCSASTRSATITFQAALKNSSGNPRSLNRGYASEARVGLATGNFLEVPRRRTS